MKKIKCNKYILNKFPVLTLLHDYRLICLISFTKMSLIGLPTTSTWILNGFSQGYQFRDITWHVLRFLGPESNSWVSEHYSLGQTDSQCENRYLCNTWDPRKKQMAHTNWESKESPTGAGRAPGTHEVLHRYHSHRERARRGNSHENPQMGLCGKGPLKARQLWLKDGIVGKDPRK